MATSAIKNDSKTFFALHKNSNQLFLKLQSSQNEPFADEKLRRKFAWFGGVS
jgi:hypothetical protein